MEFYKNGQFIFLIGDIGLKFYILIKGILKIMIIKDLVVFIYCQSQIKMLKKKLKITFQANISEKYL